MDELDNHQLEGLLRDLGDKSDTQQTTSQSGSQPPAQRLGAALQTVAATQTPQPHLSLDQLQANVDSRQAQGDSWEMPDHLSACQLCLESFEILLEQGLPESEPAVLERFAALRTGPRSPAPSETTSPYRFPVRRLRPWAAAAAILILTLGTWALVNRTPAAGQVDDDGLRLADGSAMLAGAAIPAEAVLDATQETHITTPDQSKLTIAADSRLAVKHTRAAGTTIDLHFGKITASVVKQDTGRHFMVTTPLGKIMVVGTKFVVTSSNQDVTVFESAGVNAKARKTRDKVASVEVAVLEGTVQVMNDSEKMSVPAGKRAVLHTRPTWIELLER